jgi:uncharacterized phage protein gp47/JayE
MAFTIPTISSLIDRIKGDINARMGNTNALIPRSLAYVLAHVLAGATWGLYLYQQWIARQVIPDTAEGTYLERWARLFGLSKNPAMKASGSVDVQGAAGSDLLNGSLMQRIDNVEYTVTGDYHWTSNETKVVSVEAVEAGVAGNFDYAIDASLQLVSPPAGIVATCPLRSPGITGGQDAESDSSLLDRLLTRLANPPQGGAASDYVLWAQSTPTVPVDLVWPQAFLEGMPLGQVRVVFTIEDVNDDGTVLPTFNQCAQVQGTLNPKIPVTAIAIAMGPTDHAVTLEMNAELLPGYTINQVTTNVRREIQSLFRERAEITFSASEWRVENSRIVEAISRADGIDWFALIHVDGGDPNVDVVLAGNEYPTIVDAGVIIHEN